MSVTSVKNLDLKLTNIKRAGVIIYTFRDGVIYFGLGLDAKTHDLTDFGGTVTYKLDKNFVQGALREFQEETLELFDPLKIDDVQDCQAIYDEENIIIFIPINLDPDIICQEFNNIYQKYTSTDRVEICGITWLNCEEFINSINSENIMFSRIKALLFNGNIEKYIDLL